MNRRNFVSAALAASGVSLATKALAIGETTNVLEGIYKALLLRKAHQLKAGEVYIVQKNSALNLPTSPANGDSVRLIVEANTLWRPSVVNFNGVKISGRKEPLVLDSISNFFLVYDGNTKDWRLA